MGSSWLVAGVFLLVVAAGLLYAAYQRGHLLATSVVLATVGAIAFVLAAVAVGTDFRNADGFADCWPACTTLQKVIPFGLFVGPSVSVLSTLTAAVSVGGRGGPTAR